jgi:membrane protein YdbS with pleckstrin-like domain
MAVPLPDNPALSNTAPSLPDPGLPSPADLAQNEGRPDRGAEIEETDVWWGSYSGRTILPGFLICLSLTVLLLILDWYLGTWWRRSDLISSTVLSLIGALWFFQVTRCVYRMIAVNYRLTCRRLLYTRGFKLPDCHAIELVDVAEVWSVRGPLERLLGVGRIYVGAREAKSAPLVLDGVLAPDRVARLIRRRARQAQTRP